MIVPRRLSEFEAKVAHGDVSCTLAKKVMGRAFTPKAVKGWKCYDATKAPTPLSYSGNCKKGSAEVRGNLLGQASRATAHGTVLVLRCTEGTRVMRATWGD